MVESQIVSVEIPREKGDFFRLLRREDDHDPAAVHLRVLLQLRDRLQAFDDPVDQLVSFVDVGVFAAAEDYREDHLVLVGQEFFGPRELGLQIVLADLGAQPELFVLAVMRMAFVLPLLLLVLEFAEIHDAANRRLLLRRDFHQVEAKVFSTLKGFGSFEDAELIAFRSDDADGRIADLFVDPLRLTVEGDGTIS